MDASLFNQIVEITLKYMSMGGWSATFTDYASNPTTLIDQLEMLWPLLQNIFNNFLGLLSDLFQIFNIFDFLPASWTAIIMATITVIVALRLYAFFKDVSVGGFQI